MLCTSAPGMLKHCHPSCHLPYCYSHPTCIPSPFTSPLPPQANESLEQEIATARDSPSPLVAARARLEETKADKEKFLKLIASLEARPGLEIAAWGGVLPALHWSMPPHCLHIDGVPYSCSPWFSPQCRPCRYRSLP